MAILIQDNFTAADATDVNGRTPSPTNTPGNTWAVVVVGGTGAQIFANRCYGIGVATVYALIESSISDGTVSAVLRIDDVAPANQSAIIVRSTSTANASNLWIIVIVQVTQKFELYEVLAGVFTLKDSIDFTIAEDTDYNCSVTMTADSFSSTITGGSRALIATDSTHQSATIHGGAMVGTNTSSIDTFIVESAAVGVTVKQLAALGVG